MSAPTNVVAIVYSDDGSEHDRTFNWESAQSYALAGHAVKAIANDGHMTIERAQRLYDHERALYRDCFGIEPYPEATP